MHRLRPHLPPLILFAVLTLWACWPVWLAPATRLPAFGDAALNTYILCWDQFALFHQIGDFFGANVYWPNARALAYGELMLTQAILSLPARLVTAAPAAIYNFALLEGYFFSALAAYALGLFYFRSRAAAALAGVVYGFAATRLRQPDHLQLLHAEGLPLMILGLEWILRGDARRRLLGCWLLGAAALGQWLASWYWAVFTLGCFGPYALARLVQRRGRLIPVLAALVPAVLLTLPLVMPYRKLRSTYVMVRPEIAVLDFHARPGDFLLPIQRSLAWGWAWRPAGETGADPERYLFPGLLPLVALGAGVVVWGSRRRRLVTARRFPLGLWCAITLLLLSFCFGSHLRTTLPGGAQLTLPMPYAVLVRVLPAFDQVRVTARWIQPALLGVALLAGWGWLRWFGPSALPVRRRIGWLLAVALVVEHLSLPLPIWTVPDRPSALARWLEEQPYPTPTLLLPVDPPLIMLETAFHHQPLVNGNNGYFPPRHRLRMRELERFPDDDVLAALWAMQVRCVAIDPEHFPPPAGDDWPAALDRLRSRRPEVVERVLRVGRWWVVLVTPPPPGSPLRLPAIGSVPDIPLTGDPVPQSNETE